MINKRDFALTKLLLGLKSLNGITNQTLVTLLETKKTALITTKIFNLDFVRSLGIANLNKYLPNVEQAWLNTINNTSKTLTIAQQQNIAILYPYMPEYPQRLLKVSNYPAFIFCKGNIAALNAAKMIGVIGTRQPNSQNSQLGQKLTAEFVRQGCTTVGGLAVGSDTIGHQTTLDNHGQTIAILPTALDERVYPAVNKYLAQNIVNHNGALVSTYVPGTYSYGRNFVGHLIERDQWQAAMSDGLYVIETHQRSGTNHTIRHALDEGKPVAITTDNSINRNLQPISNQIDVSNFIKQL